ncbi:hypothetical protein, partial [Ensifer aridi]|uniref:hypothetical protein n=1 Tax=Ensifer aridi TaxID=1708715 RepID=UPI0015E41ED0
AAAVATVAAVTAVTAAAVATVATVAAVTAAAVATVAAVAAVTAAAVATVATVAAAVATVTANAKAAVSKQQWPPQWQRPLNLATPRRVTATVEGRVGVIGPGGRH